MIFYADGSRFKVQSSLNTDLRFATGQFLCGRERFKVKVSFSSSLINERGFVLQN